MKTSIHPCWLCESENTKLIKAGNLHKQVSASDFRITDANYGTTADIYRCADCGFQFCPTVTGVAQHYQKMDDADYEATRSERALQAKKILELIKKHKPGGALLDIGAGSGILVEQARKLTFEAVGVEPSTALSATAQRLGLPVINGVLPQPSLSDRFDVVTLIDVIEHVDAPRQLMQEASKCMKRDAICVLVTPDVNSIAARLMRRKWWHYRLAHISYFDTGTLRRLAGAAGLEIVAVHRPGWYFPASYLAARLMHYLPRALRVDTPAWLDKFTIPLNLFDSLLVICKKSDMQKAQNA